MKQIISIFLIAIFLLSSIAYSQENNNNLVLCIKKKFKSKSKIKLKKYIKTFEGSCPDKYIQVRDALDGGNLINQLAASDGSGSGLDADTLDGLDSSAFATASTVSTISNSLNDLSDKVSPDNIITVALSGGDFNDLAEAIDSISDASENNPYLVKVGPGVFTLSGEAPNISSGITVQGSGTDSTIITGLKTDAFNTSLSCIFQLSLGGKISDLTIINTANTGVVDGIYITSVNESDEGNYASYSTRIDRVKIVLSQSSASAAYSGIVVSTGDLVIKDTLINISGSSGSQSALRLYNSGSNILIDNLTANVDSADSGDSGILINNASVEIKNSDVFGYASSVQALGGTINIYNSSLRSNNKGLSSSSNGTTTVVNSQLISNVDGVYVNGSLSTVNIFSSYIDAADNIRTVNSGSATCAGITDASGGFYSNSCE